MKLLDYCGIEIHINANGTFSANVDGSILISEKLSLRTALDRVRKALEGK